MTFYFTFPTVDSSLISAPELKVAHWIVGKSLPVATFWANIIGHYFLLLQFYWHSIGPDGTEVVGFS